jgi:hypothetical protein
MIGIRRVMAMTVAAVGVFILEFGSGQSPVIQNHVIAIRTPDRTDRQLGLMGGATSIRRSFQMKVEMRPLASIQPYENNPPAKSQPELPGFGCTPEVTHPALAGSAMSALPLIGKPKD